MAVGLIGQASFVNSGQEALQYLTGTAPYQNRECYPLPKLVLLDLTMPDVSGLEVLQRVSEEPALRQIPIVVFTRTEAPELIDRALSLGAWKCLFKTSDVSGWVDMISQLGAEFGLCPVLRLPAAKVQTKRRAA